MKFKSKTRKRLTILLCIVLLAGFGLAGLYKYRKIRIERGFAAARVEGLAAAQAGDNAKVIDKLGFYLGRYPTDEQVLIAFIKARQKVEDPQGRHIRDTISASRRLLSVNPGRTDERRGLMELYAKLDQRTEALDHAETLLKQIPTDAKALEIRTMMLIRLGRGTKEQRDAAQAWVDAEPLNLDGQITLIQLRKRDGESLADITGGLEKSAALDEPRKTLLTAIACGIYGDLAGADKNLKAAATMKAPDERFSAMLISQMRAMSMTDEADDLQKKTALTSTGAEFRWQFATRLWEKKEYEGVLELLNDLDSDKVDSNINLLAIKAMSLKALGREKEAAPIVTAVSMRDDPLARAWSTALRQSVAGEKIDVRQLIEDCKKALAKDPYNVFILTFLGDAQVQQKDMNLAVEAYERATGANMTWSMPPLRLGRLLLSQGRFEQAREAASIAWQRSKKTVIDPKTGQKSTQYSGDAAILLAETLGACEQAGVSIDAEKLFPLVEEIQQKTPAEPNTIDLYVRLLVRQRKTADAKKIVNSALAMDKALPANTLLRLASVSRATNLDLEEQCLSTYEKKYGNTPELAFTRAIRLHADGHSKEGRQVIEQGLSMAGEKDLLGWELNKARYLDLSGDEDAGAYWVTLGDKYPASIDVQQAASASARVVSNREFMDRTLDRLSKLSGEESVNMRLARGRVAVSSIKSVDDAEKVAVDLTKLVQTYRDVAEFRLLLAAALDRANKPDQAMEHLMTAVSLQSSSPALALEVARRLQAKGDVARAKQYLARVGVDSLEDPYQLREAAVLLAEQGQLDKASAILEATRASASGPETALTLAAIYLGKKELGKAEEKWREAVSVKPTLAAVLFGVSLFTSQNRTTDAQAALAMLDKIKLDPGVKELVWGDYLRQSRQYHEAEKKYLEAVKLDPKNVGAWQSAIGYELVFGKLVDAASLIDQGHTALPDNAGMTAIHAHLGVMKEVGDDARARSIASLFVSDPVANVAAIDALAALIEARKQADPLKYSATVQDFAERFPKMLVAQVLLAEMHLELGRPEKANQVCLRILSDFGTSEEAIYRCATVQEGAAAWEDLLKTAAKWKAQFPASAQNSDLAAARAYLETARYAQAADLLQPYIKQGASEPAKNQVLLRLDLKVLAAAGRGNEADQLASDLMKSSEGRALVVTAIAAPVPEANARKWLEEAWTQAAKDKTDAQLSVAIAWSQLAARTGKDADRARAHELLVQVTTGDKATSDILTGAGMAMETIKDPTAAEQLYQRALATGANNPVAQNNLAVMLAAKGDKKNMDEAVQLVSTAIKTLPNQPALRDTLAAVLARDKQWDKAVASMTEAVHLEPVNIKWRIRLANYLADSGKAEDALRQLDIVDSLGTSPSGATPEIRAELAKVRIKLKN